MDKKQFHLKGKSIMKNRYIILGIILLIDLFVFIPGGMACPEGYTDECCKAYDEYQEATMAYNHCIRYPPGCIMPDDDADYDDYIKCRESSCREARRRLDVASSRIFSLVDQGYCISNDMPRIALTVTTAKDTYSPGETVIVQGSVKDAEGNAIPGVRLVIEIEGTGLPTSTGTMQDVTHYDSRIPLPKDFSEGTYTVKVTASKEEYPAVSRTNIFNVGLPKISLCPSTVPGGDVDKTIEIVGSGFSAHEEIKIVLDGTVVTEISADAVRSFRVKFNIPKTERIGAEGEKHTIEAIGKLHTANAEFAVGPSLDDIENVWFRWGEEEGEWPDGSTDTHRAFHHCLGGGAAANARQAIVRLPDQKQEASHFGCVACQWKTLYFFVQQAKKGNLGGWEFFPIKAAFGIMPGEWGGHHAVVLYPAHGNWKTDGYVFDPHQKGKPDSWAVQHISVWDRVDRFFVSFDGYKFDPYWFGGKIVDGSFVRDYDLGCGFKDAYHYDAYERFPDAYVDEWMTPEETEKYRAEYNTLHGSGEAWNLIYDPDPFFNMMCPVNVLVVNSAGEQLGLTANDEWVSEFKPEKFDTWPGDDNTPVWYIELPKGDAYTILITGTGSGDLEVFAAPEGSRVVFKYPPVEVSAGDKFSMKLDADDPGTPLDTPRGQVSPTEIPIEEYVAIADPTRDSRPPTASFSIMPENPEVGDYIVVASTSSDPDGDMLTYSWYVDGVSRFGNSPNWEWVDAEAGEYIVTLEIDDGRGGSDEYSMAVTVVGDGEDAGTNRNILYFLLIPIAGVIIVLVSRRGRKK
jgi:hypothetical protein